ncbi:hypothetical protein B0T10DRAFT_568540 [Thelonectria olida]|uniref:Uncharacterized protein n=1 Tax=Thelonectria olida TaxID=1576542 RepID=A0A9P9AEP2_9HYPO|nr:hypothetical protein B0T10DRAFT_568540 [Thelonectria olida]
MGKAKSSASPEREHTEDHKEGVSLATYLESTHDLCPGILGSAELSDREDKLAEKMSVADRRQVYCGLDSRDEVSRICLSEDERVSSGAGISFDADSVIGFLSGLAVAK